MRIGLAHELLMVTASVTNARGIARRCDGNRNFTMPGKWRAESGASVTTRRFGRCEAAALAFA